MRFVGWGSSMSARRGGLSHGAQLQPLWPPWGCGWAAHPVIPQTVASVEGGGPGSPSVPQQPFAVLQCRASPGSEGLTHLMRCGALPLLPLPGPPEPGASSHTFTDNMVAVQQQALDKRTSREAIGSELGRALYDWSKEKVPAPHVAWGCPGAWGHATPVWPCAPGDAGVWAATEKALNCCPQCAPQSDMGHKWLFRAPYGGPLRRFVVQTGGGREGGMPPVECTRRSRVRGGVPYAPPPTWGCNIVRREGGWCAWVGPHRSGLRSTYPGALASAVAVASHVSGGRRHVGRFVAVEL